MKGRKNNVHYEIYIDQYIFINFVVDFFLLLLVKKIIRCSATHLFTFLGAFAGAVLSALFLFVKLSAMYKLLVGSIVISVPMVLIACKKFDRKLLIKGILWLYLLSVLYAGIMQWLFLHIPVMTYYYGTFVGTILFTYVVYVCVKKLYFWMQQQTEQRKLIYPVEIHIRDKQFFVEALLDTGNSLVEPISQKPVCIIEKQIWEKHDTYVSLETVRAIPFHSIGKKHGIMFGTEVEEIIIYTDEGKIFMKDVMMGMSEYELSKSDSYQMILHPALFKNIECGHMPAIP